MLKSVFLVLLACLLLAMGHPGGAHAQLECTDPDLLALVFDNGDINFAPAAYQQYQLHVWLLNPTAPSGEFLAFEFALTLPANQLLMGIDLPPDALNVGNFPDIIVGLGTCEPMVGDHFEFATLNLFSFDNLQGDFFVQPTTVPSIPNEMAYLDCDGLPFVPMTPISGDTQLPVARVNGPLLDYCDPVPDLDMWVDIYFEGDFDNLAGTSVGASDGYDSDYDQVDYDLSLTFPHDDWPAGPYYKRDVKAYYDPTEAMKQWTFVTNTSNVQSDGEMVTVTFHPSFATPATHDFKLRDLTEGNVVDLNQTQSYTYYSPPGTEQRTFELTIGDSGGPGMFHVDVDAVAGNYSDRDNRAAIHSTASDDYDPLLDIPEPGPPPANYVTASFYQPSWPLGPRFTSDIRAVYDPTSDDKTWPVMVETDQSGSVILAFDPSFEEGDYDLYLKDMQTGQEFDLFPNLTYVFPADGSGVYHFLLTVGSPGIPDLNPTSRYLEVGWSMIGMPLIPPDYTVDEVILNQAPGYAYVFGYMGSSGYFLLEGDDWVNPGTGYWIATDTGFSWTMDGYPDPDGTEVPLRNGWTLIGNPLWFPAPFEGIYVRYLGTQLPWLDAVAAGWVSMGVLSYDNFTEDYVDAVDLRPWHGYWVNGLHSGVSLWFHWPNFQVLPARLYTAKPELPEPGLAWESALTMVDADQKEKTIVMGVNPEATVGFDPMYDMPQPPLSPNGGSRLAFVNPEWDLAAGDYFTRDIRPVSGEPLAWDAVIITSNPGRVELSWDSTVWPEGVDFQLYLPEENRVVVMSMRDVDNLHLEVGNHPVPIVIRTPDMVTGVEDMPGMNYEVGVHPNPFNPTTTIHFDLPRPASAEIRLFSVRGELVDVLGGETYQAGRQEVIWNGRDRFGRNAPSGSYFARLYVDGQAIGSVTKMSLIR